MKPKPQGTGVPEYVPLDENGEEIRRKKKRAPRVKKAKPEAILPKTPLQTELIEIYKPYGRTGFATDAEFGAFRSLEKKFNPSSQALEAAVWEGWIRKMIAWAQSKNTQAGKPVIDIFKLCSAIGNKESWASYWHQNKKQVERQLKSKVSAKELEKAYEEQNSTW